MGYPLGSGGAVRTLGLWLFWLWVGGSLMAAVLCFFHAPMLTLAFFGALGIGFFGAMANAIDPINVPWGIAVCATVGMFLGLAIGLGVPMIRRARSGSSTFFLGMALAVLVSWVVAMVGLRLATHAPWNCASTCRIDTVALLVSVDALTLVLVSVGLAIAGPERECREPALGPSEAAGAG